MAEPATAEPTPEERRALFRIVRGEPTDAEVAALTAVLAVTAARAARPSTGRRSRWNDPVGRLRTALTPGPGAWLASTWPR